MTMIIISVFFGGGRLRVQKKQKLGVTFDDVCHSCVDTWTSAIYYLKSVGPVAGPEPQTMVIIGMVVAPVVVLVRYRASLACLSRVGCSSWTIFIYFLLARTLCASRAEGMK